MKRFLSIALACTAVVLVSACSKTQTATTTTAAGAAGTTTAPQLVTQPGTTPNAPGKVEAAKVTVITTSFGKALGQQGGLVLYTWDKEKQAGGKIECTADCIAKWPPLLTKDAGSVALGDGVDRMHIGAVERPDGLGTQVTVDGRAVYTMSADTPGQANCQGAGGWWIINPDGTSNMTAEGAAK